MISQDDCSHGGAGGEETERLWELADELDLLPPMLGRGGVYLLGGEPSGVKRGFEGWHWGVASCFPEWRR